MELPQDLDVSILITCIVLAVGAFFFFVVLLLLSRAIKDRYVYGIVRDRDSGELKPTSDTSTWHTVFTETLQLLCLQLRSPESTSGEREPFAHASEAAVEEFASQFRSDTYAKYLQIMRKLS